MTPPRRSSTRSPEETQARASGWRARLGPATWWRCIGELGAGKTCFLQGLARGLGVTSDVTSPTFVLVNHYRGRLPVYHLDAYRTESLTELLELGIEEMMHGDGVTVDRVGGQDPPAVARRHAIDGPHQRARRRAARIAIESPLAPPRLTARRALYPAGHADVLSRAHVDPSARRALRESHGHGVPDPRVAARRTGRASASTTRAPDALADAELLAILLGTGTRGRNAVDVARDLLAHFGSLSALAGRSVAELAGVRGVGRAKAVRLAAAFELSRRLRSRNGRGARDRCRARRRCYGRYGPLMEDLEQGGVPHRAAGRPERPCCAT